MIELRAELYVRVADDRDRQKVEEALRVVVNQAAVILGRELEQQALVVGTSVAPAVQRSLLA